MVCSVRPGEAAFITWQRESNGDVDASRAWKYLKEVEPCLHRVPSSSVLRPFGC